MLDYYSLNVRTHGYTSMIPAIFEKGNKFCDFLFVSLVEKSSGLLRKKSTLKQNNFLILKQILSYTSWRPWEKEEK